MSNASVTKTIQRQAMENARDRLNNIIKDMEEIREHLNLYFLPENADVIFQNGHWKIPYLPNDIAKLMVDFTTAAACGQIQYEEKLV